MKALTRTRTIGGSLVVTIPKEIVREESLIEGELVNIAVEKVRRKGFGLLEGIKRFAKENELDSEI